MLRNTSIFLFVALTTAADCADESKQLVRPITEAESVLAVYRENWGLLSAETPAIIFAAWPDGYVAWSENRVKGGAPYRTARVEPKKITLLLMRFETDGLFSDETLNQGHFGPDSEFITVFIKSEKKQVKMQSWHELFEDSDKHVATDKSAGPLDGRRRLNVLRGTPADYLFFRFVWSETRAKLTDLIPRESSATAAKPSMKAGVLSWQEPVVKP